MNITNDGWITWAIRDPGPASRWAAFGNVITPVNAIYHHSFEGWFNPVSDGDGYNVMNDPGMAPTAWHGTVTSRPVKFKGASLPPGTLFQHYPINARLQHANGGNVIGPGFELEGLAPTPITPDQVKTYLAIHRDIAEWTKKSYARPTGLVEHREAPGAQTSCPSERYAPLWAAIKAGGEVTKEEYEALLVRMTNLEWLVTGKSGSEAVAIAKDFAAKGISPVLTRVNRFETEGDSVARTNINGHVLNHSAQPGGVADHIHEGSTTGKVVRAKG